MSSLVHVVLGFRRALRATSGFVAVAAFASLDVLGVFATRAQDLGLEHGLVAVAWTVIFAARTLAKFKAEQSDTPRPALDLELGLLLVVAVYAIVQLGGGLGSNLYALVFVMVAFATSFAPRVLGLALVAMTIGFEAVLYFVTESRQDVELFATHAGFVAAFGLLNLLFTRAEIARVRHRSRLALSEDKAKVKDDARLFRLISAPSAQGAKDDERLFQSSMDEVHNALFHLMDMLRQVLGLHTCVLLFRVPGTDQLRIAELVTDSDDVADGPFPIGEGAVGAVASRGLVTSLRDIRPGYKGLCYYRGPAAVRTFLGVPVADQGRLAGALCADRMDDRAFTAHDEEILRGAADQVLRTLENERTFVQLERSKREQTILHRASQTLGAALDEEAVIDAWLSAASDIAPFDMAAVTAYDASERRHLVRRAVGDDAGRVQDLTFKDNTSLTAMAVKNCHYLPYRGEFDPKQQYVFTKRTNLKTAQSLLILPLVVRELTIGTVVLGAHRLGAFGDTVRPTLQVLANQVAVALANAASVRRLEELATIDGPTGCLNKRTFLEELDNKIRSAHRFDRKLSLLVTDIDHFKNVNDTYGHATGDVVIEELGRILRKVKRETDVVARFGGEEFCLLCEETDMQGAVLLAERLREEVGNAVFTTGQGELRITASVGVATVPVDAAGGSELFEAADQALYAAKHGGRNQVCAVRRVA